MIDDLQTPCGGMLNIQLCKAVYTGESLDNQTRIGGLNSDKQ